jgi:hypothetical protein
MYRDTEEKFIAILEIDHSTTPFLTSPNQIFYLSYITDAYIEDQVGVTESVLTGKNTFKPTLETNQSLNNVIATFPINDESIFVLNKSFEVFHIETETTSPTGEQKVNFDDTLVKTDITTSYFRDEKILKIIYDYISNKLYILTNLGNIVIILLNNFINGTTTAPQHTKLTNVSAVDIFLFGPNKVGFLNNNGEIKYNITNVNNTTTYPIIPDANDKIISVACNNKDNNTIVVYINTNKELKCLSFNSGNNTITPITLTPPTSSYNISSPGKCRLLLRDNIFVLINSDDGNLFCYRLNINNIFVLLTISDLQQTTNIKFLDAIFVKEATGNINYLITKVKKTTIPTDTYEFLIFKFNDNLTETQSHVSTITGINHNTFFCGSHINRLFILDSDEIVSDCQKCSLTEHDLKTNECMCAGFENLSVEEDTTCQEISTSILELAKTEITLLLSM